MPMKICPSCGYDPDPQEVAATDAELRSQRLRNIFSKNLQNSWWLKQPVAVCKWLKPLISPRRVLDAGCGDGRWFPAIQATWDVEYTGLDRIKEHQELNAENFRDSAWPCIDFCAYAGSHDAIFAMGVFNPTMKNQEAFVKAIKRIGPANVVVLFDLKQTGAYPHEQLEPEYRLKNQFEIAPDLQGPNQEDVVWLYGR